MISQIFLILLFNFLASNGNDVLEPIFAKNVHWSPLIGKWYIVKKGPNADSGQLVLRDIKSYECIEETFSINPKNKFILDYTISYKETNVEEPQTDQGWVTFNEETPARTTFYIENKATSADLIATDYTKWALASTMGKSHSNENIRIFWILSRTPNLDGQILETIESFIESFGGSKSDLVTYPNVNCPNT